MPERIRELDVQAVEAAEFARKNNKVVVAAEMAAIGLGLTSQPLTLEEISKIAQDPHQRAVLACLARIHVDSLKTAANQARLPGEVLGCLEMAAKTILLVYRNRILRASLENVTQDHRGREHNFLPEMGRDEAKTLFASSILYGEDERMNLIVLGEGILEQLYERLPENHPTRSLSGIEFQISRLGRTGAVDLEKLMRDFDSLKVTNSGNDHRIATVASWLVVWGRKVESWRIYGEGERILNQLLKVHPEWRYMVGVEEKKVKMQEWRQLLFRLLTPITTDPNRRRDLYINLNKN